MSQACDTSDFHFILPGSVSDLLDSSGSNYYVKHIYTKDELPEKLRLCKQMALRKDPFYVFDHFDTFYSIIEDKHNSSNNLDDLMKAFNLLHFTVNDLGETLTKVLHSKELMSPQDCIKYLNLTKMILFLQINTVKRIDTIRLRQQEIQNQNNLLNQKKRKKDEIILEKYADWDGKRHGFVVSLFNILQEPIEKLWRPPIVEENFVDMVCDVCYRTIELKHYRQESKHYIDSVFQILGLAIKNYNHGLHFPIRILQILRNTEHASHSIANGIHLLYEEYGITNVFASIIKEIIEALSMDAADTGVSRNFSNFLMELAVVSPKLVIPHLSMLCDELLNCESHVLRNCILQIMGDAIIGELTSEELDEKQREARDEFLENLLAHINDVSAHVRARVLMIWLTLKEQDAVPLSFQLKVLTGAVERLQDKTLTVRNKAVQLIKAFLERNPFSAKLTLEELLKKHDEEVAKMEELRKRAEEEREKSEQLEEQWNEIVPELSLIVQQNLKDKSDDAFNITHEVDDENVKRISSLLMEKKYLDAVNLVRKCDLASDAAMAVGAMSEEDRLTYYVALLKSYIFLANVSNEVNDELVTQIKTVTFYQDCINFSKVLTKTVPKIQELLLSKTNSDVMEAVNFFTTGYMFGIKGTESGMRNMLYLVWAGDKDKRDAVSDAYKKVLFTTQLSDRAHAIKVIQNLSKFLEELEYGHYLAMEVLVREWVATEDINVLIIQVLFERFTMKLEGTTPNEARLALHLLIMCAESKPSVAAANIGVIESIGLGDRGKRDPRIFAGCLNFLLNSVDRQGNKRTLNTRYDADSPLVEKVRHFYVSFFFHPKIKDFDNITIQTLKFFYEMCQKPDVICQEVILAILSKCDGLAVQGSGEITPSQQAEAEACVFTQADSQMPGSQRMSGTQHKSFDELRLPGFLLKRLIHMVGYLVIKEMIFLDNDVYFNMQHRQELADMEKKTKNKAGNSNAPRRTNALNMSAMESLKRMSTTTTDSPQQQEPEDDLVGASAEDNIAELINHIFENVLLADPKSLLVKITVFIIDVCKFPVKYRDQELQQAAVLALIRLMTISETFCNKYIPFLVNILTYSKNIKVKCNIIIGLCDLMFRFPNVTERWNAHFYSTLHEENTDLRLTTVKTLSYLISLKMILVKSQMSDLAICLVDPDEEIRARTQLFFKEIAGKENILYNNLPDIISRLSDTNLNLQEEKYQTIMRFILELIQKDRQVETLVQKLCQRFKVTREERQWRDTAFSLSLLNYNERTIKILNENLNLYKDKLPFDEIYQSFKLIITNANRNAKPELKAVLTEFESRLNECREIKDGDAEKGAGAEGGSAEGGGNANKTLQNRNAKKSNANVRKSARKNTKGRRRKDSSEEDNESVSEDLSEEEEEEITIRNKPPQKTTSRGKGGRSKNVLPSSSETSESDDDDTPQATRQGKTPGRKPASTSLRATSRHKVIEESDSSEESNHQRKKKRPSNK